MDDVIKYSLSIVPAHQRGEVCKKWIKRFMVFFFTLNFELTAYQPRLFGDWDELTGSGKIQEVPAQTCTAVILAVFSLVQSVVPCATYLNISPVWNGCVASAIHTAVQTHCFYSSFLGTYDDSSVNNSEQLRCIYVSLRTCLYKTSFHSLAGQ